MQDVQDGRIWRIFGGGTFVTARAQLLMRERLAKHGLLSSDRLGSRFRGDDG